MTPSLALLGLEWARPAGALALVLPALVWLFARLRARPPSVATGTLALWKEVGGADPRQALRRRRGTPPATRWAIAALLVGALALAGPRRPGTPLPRAWTVIVDHRPSTSLPAPRRSGTRLELALERALAWLEPRLEPEDRVRWRSFARAPLDLAPRERPPATWLAHPAAELAPPPWSLFDEPGTLWVSDLVPEPAPERAGVFASGAEQTPGPVAAEGTTRFDWDGETLVAVPGGLPVRAVVLAGKGEPFPDVLRALAVLWARERGHALAEDAAEVPVVLVLELAGEGEPIPVEAGRDGWWARGRAVSGGLASVDGGPGLGRWLATAPDAGGAAARVLVDRAPGRVRLAWRALEPPAGDPAAFAVSWSRLFESASLPPPGVVALAERERAGPAVERAPRPAPVLAARTGEPRRAARADAWLAAAAALLAAIAVSLRGAS